MEQMIACNVKEATYIDKATKNYHQTLKFPSAVRVFRI